MSWGAVARLGAARVLWAAPTLLVVLAVSFALMRAAPGGPFDLERPLDASALEQLRRVYNLDAPLWRQFLDYLAGLAHGDLGPSFAWRDYSVAELLARAIPVSAGLGAAALALALPTGAALGLIAAGRGGATDALVGAVSSVGVVLPSFVVAPALQLVFGLWLKWLPVGGSEGWRAYVLPVLVLAAPLVAAVARLTRAAAIEALEAPPALAAIAYGLPARVRLARAFRAALLPLVSYLGPAAASVMTGSVVVETLFGLPGLGHAFVTAALDRDYTVSLGAALVAAVAALAFNLISDIAYLFVDPRVRS